MKFFSKMFYCCGWYGIFLERSVVSETKYHCERFSGNERAKTNNRLADYLRQSTWSLTLHMCKLFFLFADLCTFWKQKLSLHLRDTKYIHSPTFSMKMLIFIFMKLGNKGTDITFHYGTCVIATQVWLMRKQKSCQDYSFKWIVLRVNAIVLVSWMKKWLSGLNYNGQALLCA
jgi:hypothetical protein